MSYVAHSVKIANTHKALKRNDPKARDFLARSSRADIRALAPLAMPGSPEMNANLDSAREAATGSSDTILTRNRGNAPGIRDRKKRKQLLAAGKPGTRTSLGGPKQRLGG